MLRRTTRVTILAAILVLGGGAISARADGPLRARLLDARGLPVAGATIGRVYTSVPAFGQAGEGVVTDAEGRFAVADPFKGVARSERAATIDVELPGGRVYPMEVAPGRPAGEVVLKLPTFVGGPSPKGPEPVDPMELAGVVVDAEGLPVAGATVHAWPWVPFPDAKTLTTTGDDGQFRRPLQLPGVGKGEKVPVRVSKAGFAPRLYLARPLGERGWVVALDRSTAFVGRVVDREGKGVAGALVRGDAGPKQMDGGMMTASWTEATSGPDGTYRLAVEPGYYEVQVRAPGRGVARLPRAGIAADEVGTLDIPLEPGVDFAARVVDHETGRPVAGLKLGAWEQPGIGATSDDSGRLEVRAMMPGKFNFTTVECKGYVRWWSPECLSAWSRFEKANRFGFQRNLDGLDFDLKPGMAPATIEVERAATIRGRVLDPDGKPVSGATVAPALTGSGNSLTGDTRFSVSTDKDGRFEAPLPASGAIAYNLVAHDGGYTEWRTWANGVLPPMKTTPGQVIDDVEIRLTRPGLVSGRVVDASGKPIAGREVRSSPLDKDENRYYDPTTTTGPDGRFTLRFVRPARHYIQAAPFWLEARNAPAGTSRVVEVEAGKAIDGVELVGEPSR